MPDQVRTWTAVLFDRHSKRIGQMELRNGAPSLLTVKPKLIGRTGTAPILFKVSGELSEYINTKEIIYGEVAVTDSDPADARPAKATPKKK